MLKLKSNIWNFFKINEQNQSKADCKLCPSQTTQIIRGKNTKSYSTKPLWNHIKYLHPKEYKNIFIQDENQDDGTSDESGNENKQKISSTSKEDLQLTMQQSLERTKPWDINNAKSKEISTKICTRNNNLLYK